MKSFITSIEPLVQSMKRQAIAHTTVVDDTIDHSQVNLFLNEIESIYNDLSAKQQKIKDNAVMVAKKKDFLMQIDNLLANKPKLQSFLDAVQEIINQNKYKLRAKKRYSLNSKYKPRHIESEM